MATKAKGSFRGVPFYTAGTESAIGRRVVVHEYPQRDLPYTEDMGRAPRAFQLEVFVLGADYVSERNALIAAIEAPGPGSLVHPYLGEMQVAVLSCRLRETTADGGAAYFTLELIEAGAARFPSSDAGTQAKVQAAAGGAQQTVLQRFAQTHTVARKPQFVAQASTTIFGAALDGISGAVSTVRAATGSVAALKRDVDKLRTDLTTLIYTPASAAQALLATVQQLVSTVATTPRDALALARTLYSFGTTLPLVGPTTASRATQASNQAELVQLTRVAAVTEGAKAAAGVAFDSYQEALAVRDELVDTADELLLVATSDEVFDALRELRAAAVRDITVRGADLARVVVYSPSTTMPALVLAHTLYADATREAELLARNRLRHPLFVAGARPLEVLSDAA